MAKVERVYTERVTVRLLASEQARLMEKLDAQTPISAALRDAGLRAIGREDLVLHTHPPSGYLATKVVDGGDVRAFYLSCVRLSAHQFAALDIAARDKDVALSALLRDSLMAELKLPIRKALDQWYPLGKRRSRPPEEKPAPKRKAAKKPKVKSR